MDDVKKPYGRVRSRVLPPAMRVVVLCAFFLGLLSMHVLAGTGVGPMHHGETRGATVAEASVSASMHGHGDKHMQAVEPGGDHGMGLGECALLVACVLGLVVFAHMLGAAGNGGIATRAGPTPYRPRLVAFNDGVFQSPTPQQLSICRR